MNSITTATIIGIEAEPITVESDIAFGMPSFQIVGLPDASVREARDRIRAAIRNAGLPFPRTRVTVNLAPADIKKQGPSFDLPVALSILLADGALEGTLFKDAMVFGELSLDGTVRGISGVLAIVRMAKERKCTTVYLPKENAREAASVAGITIIPVRHLADLVRHSRGEQVIEPFAEELTEPKPLEHQMDFKDIKGQEQAKRGLEIAAAGGHNVLLKGPPGTGKTLLARALPSILPALNSAESLETTAIHSIAGSLKHDAGLMRARPFRSPHHSCSAVSLIGGGTHPRPGEVTLAHRGILFLDELPEFSRYVLEHLRQPLEDGEVTIARASHTATFPAEFTLVATMNPCPCGFVTDPTRVCTCSPGSLNKYQKKLSGPLIDRFDLVIEVPSIDTDTLMTIDSGEPSLYVRERVTEARARQAARFDSDTIVTNSEIPHAKIDLWCEIEEKGRTLLKCALDAKQLSARGFARVKKVARTIADLAGEQTIQEHHIAEALQYRPKQDLFQVT